MLGRYLEGKVVLYSSLRVGERAGTYAPCLYFSARKDVRGSHGWPVALSGIHTRWLGLRHRRSATSQFVWCVSSDYARAVLLYLLDSPEYMVLRTGFCQHTVSLKEQDIESRQEDSRLDLFDITSRALEGNSRMKKKLKLKLFVLHFLPHPSLFVDWSHLLLSLSHISYLSMNLPLGKEQPLLSLLL